MLPESIRTNLPLARVGDRLELRLHNPMRPACIEARGAQTSIARSNEDQDHFVRAADISKAIFSSGPPDADKIEKNLVAPNVC